MTPSYPYKGATASQLDPTSSSSFNDLYSAVYSAADESCKMNQQQQHPLFNEIHQPRMTVAIATVGVDAASDIPTTLNYSRASSAFTNELPISSPAVPFNLPPILGLSARPTTTTTTTTTAAADTSPHYVRSGEQADSSGSRLTAEFPRTLHHTYEPSNVRSNADDDKSSPTLSKEAIIINAQEDSKDAPRRIFPEMDDSRIPESALQLEHLVSPYAIREAEREEKEEAMGASREHPFRGFSSFISMKNMHEKLQCDDKYKSSTNDNAVNVAPANFSIRPDDGVRSYRYHHHHHHQYSPPPSSPSSSVSSAGHDDDLLAQCINNTFASQTVIEPTTIDSLDALIQASSSEKKPAIAAERERLKRPPNAYLLFNRDMRRKLLEISPKMTVAEISKEIGERWKQLSPEKREMYVRQAALIKQDHLRNHPDFIYTRRSKAELAEARKASKRKRSIEKPPTPLSNSNNSGNDNNTASNSNTLIALSSSSSSSSSQSSLSQQRQQQQPQQQQQKQDQFATISTPPPPKRRRKSGSPDGPRDPRGRKKKRHRHPTAPKHPMSGFLFFLAAVRPRVAQQFPGSTVGPISKVIAAQWRDMSIEERIPWLQKADEDKARYAREMQAYTARIERASPDETIMSDPEDLDVAVQMGHSHANPFAYVIPEEYV